MLNLKFIILFLHFYSQKLFHSREIFLIYKVMKIFKIEPVFFCLIISTLFFSCKDVQKEETNTFKDSETSVSNFKNFDFLPTSTSNQVVYHDNYVLSYVEKHEQAEWVAYELKRSRMVSNDFQRPSSSLSWMLISRYHVFFRRRN